jgi:multidrug efflux pump subunit AcrA (membrane-fusion protein)
MTLWRLLPLFAILAVGPMIKAHAQGAGDPVCAVYKRHWEQVSSGGDITAMAQAARAISSACPTLKADAAGRVAEARQRAEHDQAAKAHAARKLEAERQQAAAEAEQAAKAQAAQYEAAMQVPKFGAIALVGWADASGPWFYYGWAGSRSSDLEATRDALQLCKNSSKRDCSIAVKYSKGCEYISWGFRGGQAGWGWGATQEEARSNCQSRADNCAVPVGGCN